MTTTFLPERSQQEQLINPFVHASGYRFAHVPADALQANRERLLETAKSLSLKGSLLLGKEGLNMYVSGRDDAIRAFQEHLNTYPYFKDFSLKWSFSREQPYNRMLVRIKNEIVTMGCDSICPADDSTAPYITPQELKAKLDAGEDFVLVDTRNDYEVALGTFDTAVAFDIASFREFPEIVLSKKEEWAGKTIVTFCTGGIRCEKAAPYLLEQGFEDVYQLEGGILKYFEYCGSAHYHGECFVFDKRVAVDTNLAETDTIQCFACRMPLTKDMQEESITDMTCPHCGGSPAHGKRIQQEAA
mgnify:CR=1 FL=1